MKKNIKELFEKQVVMLEPNLPIVLDNMMATWGGVSYSQLSVLLVYLKFLALTHQTHHWIAKGDPFYGDHLLFERVYSAAQADIDVVAEKAVGLGTTANVDVLLSTTQVLKLVHGYGPLQTIPQQNELVRRSLTAEMMFLSCLKILCESMKVNGTCTLGVENMIADLADKHEGSVYLLKQRIS